MSEPQRKLRLAVGKEPFGRPAPEVCPITGVGIPECSCERCLEEQIRHHSPHLLQRRSGRRPHPPRAA